MSAYAGHWELLGEQGDPWPGDVVEVDATARHYGSMADTIREQAARLRSIANGDSDLVGKYEPALRTSAREAADYLERAEGRFDAVATELSTWVPELERAQSQSRAMLREAEDHHSVITANQPPHTAVEPSDEQAVTADQARSARLASAQSELNAVAARFRDLKRDVDATARRVADNLRDASHDSLKNHRFDGVRKWIHDNADWLSALADVFTYIATAIVVVALIVGTGGLAAAAILTAAALGVHALLAANGDGSWLDVAVDAFALATFGAGKILTSGARLALAGREGMAAYAEASSGAREAFADAHGVQKFVTWVSRSNPVFRTIDSATAGLSRFGEVMDAEYKGGLGLRLIYGDKEAAGLAKAIDEAAERLGPGKLLNAASSLMDASVPVWRTSLATDFVLKGLNEAHLPHFTYEGLAPWMTWKEEHTVHAVHVP